MVTPRSFVSPASAARISEVRRRGFATKLALQDPPIVIQLWRGDQDDEALPIGDPVHVVVEYAARADHDQRSGFGARGSFSEGTVSHLAPWDVRAGDRFRLGDADAVITSVPVAESGVQAATFQVGSDAGGVL